MILRAGAGAREAFVLPMADHLRLAEQVARAFGNEHFDAPDPRLLVPLVAGRAHERCAEADVRASWDAHTRTPCALEPSPLAASLASAVRSADWSERQHPLAGLLESVHQTARFGGKRVECGGAWRAGLTQQEHAERAKFLTGERRRQRRLRRLLRAEPETAELSDEQEILRGARLLAFCDEVALHLARTALAARSALVVDDVPRRAGDAVRVTFTPAGDGAFCVTPYPFGPDVLELVVTARLVRPGDTEDELTTQLRRAATVRQRVVLRSAGAADGRARAALAADAPPTGDSALAAAGLVRYARSTMATRAGQFRVDVYRAADGTEHLAIVAGDATGRDVLARVHSECWTGEVLGSLRCDCRRQFAESLAAIAAEGRGVLVYLRQEGRGIGLGNKIRAYALQDQGADTIEANLRLGFPADLRTYDHAAAILADLGVRSVRLLTNNADKVRALERGGIRVRQRVAQWTDADSHNGDYLMTKRTKMGHMP